MGLKITITFEGLDTVISNLDRIGEKFEQNIQDTTASLGSDALDVMREHTHVRTGRLREGDTLEVGRLSFTLANDVRYARWVNWGHMTPRGWRTKEGYRPAKRRSHVEGHFFLESAVEFVEETILDRLGEALKD